MRLLVLILLHCLSLPLVAQHRNVMISDKLSPNEPTIIINPRNTKEMMAGSNIANVHYSSNGGETWRSSVLQSKKYDVYGDPCIIIDTLGLYYYFHLSNPSDGGWIDRIVCQRSDNRGLDWTDGTFTGLNNARNQDKEWAVVDPISNTIYVTWTQFDVYGSKNEMDSSVILFSRSTDQAQTWSKPVRLSEKAGDCIDSDNTVEGAVPTVGPLGEVYVAWSGREGIWFDRSLDGGKTWLSKDISVCRTPGGWDHAVSGLFRANGLPVTVCDRSGSPNRGSIYVCWSDERLGNGDVWLSRSADQGSHWSEPVRVNNDAGKAAQFMPWMTVDQTNGYLYFVWYDRREHPAGSVLTDVYMAISKDGGRTFHNFKVSEKPFEPTPLVFAGDYNNVSAHANVVRPVWMRMDKGKTSIWTAIIDVSLLRVENAEEVPFTMSLYGNKFEEPLGYSFKVFSPNEVSVRVRNALGYVHSELFPSDYMKPGTYNRRLSAIGVPDGVYWFELVVNGEIISRRRFCLYEPY